MGGLIAHYTVPEMRGATPFSTIFLGGRYGKIMVLIATPKKNETPMFITYVFFQTSYKEGEYIVRQGAGGDTFFIISKGRVSLPLYKRL